ncbi:MAG: hypothetical protein NT069_04570 [Planctomycetota bacterium]|nr:hypothetical protein [Planctomycetota bacterium]
MRVKVKQDVTQEGVVADDGRPPHPRIYAMVLMPNHWHFVTRPTTDDQVGEFFRRLSGRHMMRYTAHYGTGGTGHRYQGRFKSFPIQSDEHLLIAMFCVERNPVRANSVELAEDWVNKADTEAELSALRHCIQRGLPFGNDRWVSSSSSSSAVRLCLKSATRPRGRSRKES